MAENERERLKTDSPISRRIVLAFLDFLGTVEPAAGIDLEGFDVVRECLEEAFKLNQSSSDQKIPHGLMVEVFHSYDKQHESRPLLDSEAASKTSVQNTTNGKLSEASKSKDQCVDSQLVEVSRDELFGQFYAALDKVNFFTATPGGDEDHAQLAKATHFFEDALLDLEKSGGQKISRNNFAETLKLQGNQAMQSKLYTEAVELYTCAIALLENNAIYYCNRAAAHTQIHKYAEAIADCTKSIELDPNYAKAYSRLGLAYYAQGKYQEALSGFYRALQLDPNNDSVRENIRVAEQKWREESHQTGGEQNTGSSHNQQTNMQGTGPAGPRSNSIPFTSIPISASLPSDFANIFMSMASAAGSSHSQEQTTQSRESRNQGSSFTSIPIGAGLPSDFARVFMNMSSAPPGQESHDQAPTGNGDGSDQPEIRIDTNINLNLEEVELSGAFRSMMDMFSQHGPQERTSRGTD
uniref:Small glutamine-rich tetratricopeptide repeat-containing protein beta n=1 Tax=Anthurium amnicola TaxID=1678845 RepID=A0A1D1ZBZ9_9ARAE